MSVGKRLDRLGSGAAAGEHDGEGVGGRADEAGGAHRVGGGEDERRVHTDSSHLCQNFGYPGSR